MINRMNAKKQTTKTDKIIYKSDLFVLLCKKELQAECIKEYRFHPTRRWRFDYAFPEYKIAIEVEGGVWTQGRHTRPKGFLNDIEKYSTATVMGWRVLRTTPSELCTRETLQMIKTATQKEE